jgi:hypothetical protein
MAPGDRLEPTSVFLLHVLDPVVFSGPLGDLRHVRLHRMQRPLPSACAVRVDGDRRRTVGGVADLDVMIRL